MPSRPLRRDQARLTPISLPRAASTTVVVAATPVVKPRPGRPAGLPPAPAPSSRAWSSIPRCLPAEPPLLTRPSATRRIASGPRATTEPVRRHPLPVDQPRVVAKPAPAPAPAPAPVPPRARLRLRPAGGDTRRRFGSGSAYSCPDRTRPAPTSPRGCSTIARAPPPDDLDHAQHLADPRHGNGHRHDAGDHGQTTEPRRHETTGTRRYGGDGDQHGHGHGHKK